MNKNRQRRSWLSAEFWTETLGWQRDERMDQASQQNTKLLTWAYVVEFFIMGLYQLYLAQYQVAAPLLVIATTISLWFAGQHRRYSNDEYGHAQLGKQYNWIGTLFAFGGVFGFLAALTFYGELNLLWTVIIIIPSCLVLVRSEQQQIFERRTWVFLLAAAVLASVLSFLFAIGIFSTTAAWLYLAAFAAFLAIIYWLYVKQ